MYNIKQHHDYIVYIIFVAVYDCLFVPERSLFADFTRGLQDIHFSSCAGIKEKANSREEVTVKAHKTGNLSISNLKNASSEAFPRVRRHS